MDVRPMTPVIGAEVFGADLSGDADTPAIRQALLDRHVLVFRDQALDADGVVAFAHRFGPPYAQPEGWATYERPHAIRVHNDGDSEINAGPDWHSDLTCSPTPPAMTVLFNHTLPDRGGDTLFANAFAAFDALSEPLRAWLETLSAVHLYRYPDGSWPDVTAEHPVIRPCPETGRKALYVNRSYTSHIAGLDPAESRMLMDLLVRHMNQPRFHARVRWRPGTVVMWDNRATQHMALWDYRPATRSGWRVDIAG